MEKIQKNIIFYCVRCMDKASQIFILKHKMLNVLVSMLEGEETAIEKKTILEFAQIIHNFFIK